MATVTDTLNLARSQLGTVESPPNSNNVKYAQWFGMNRQPWCAMFVSWVLAHIGNGSGYRFASVALSLAWARRVGRHTGEFRAGYVCCRINNGSWSGPGHTGIVEAVHSDGSVTSIEGNTSPGSAGSQRDGGGVWRRRRPRSYWNRQCIRIDYHVAVPETPTPTPSDRCIAYTHLTLQTGSTGSEVRHLQHLLQLNKEPCDVDGEFGPNTKLCLTRFQTNWRLTVDGVAGPQSWGALHHVVKQTI